LKKVFAALYKNKQTKIKPIWIVKGDATKKDVLFQREAEFIGKLVSDNRADLWKSLLIIRKCDVLTPTVTGIIAAAKDHGAADDFVATAGNVLGFKCIEWIEKYKQPDDAYQTYTVLKQANTPKDVLSRLGFINADEIKELINSKLNALPTTTIKFESKICNKCKCKGDPRYVDAPCHHTPELWHPSPLTHYHIGSLVSYHPMSTEWYHPNGISTRQYHSQSRSTRHTGGRIYKTVKTEWYHPGKHYGHRTVRATSDSTLCSCSNKSSGGCSEVWNFTYASGRWKYSDCGCYAGSTGCKKKETKEYVWSCCDKQNYGSSGCKYYYPCCKAEGGAGCKFDTSWECCSRSTSDSGCRKRYRCCGRSDGSTGCQQRYNCCNQTRGARGCRDRWSCCSNAPGHRGCQQRCNVCKNDWGTSPGCSRPYTI